MEQAGWTKPGYDAEGWEPAVSVDGPAGTLRAQSHEPIRVTETVTPVEITEPEPGVYVFDLGVQIAGWAQLTVAGEAGTEVSMRYGERLDDDGLVTIPSYGNFHSVPRAQTDIYVLDGDGRERWEPSYTYKGFRFIEVRGLPSEPSNRTVMGRRVHNDFASIGHFESGSPLLNQIRGNVRRALLNNHHHVISDTPVYEKAGWTADAQLTAVEICIEDNLNPVIVTKADIACHFLGGDF
jgi:alpha-L-rhamnosidase